MIFKTSKLARKRGVKSKKSRNSAPGSCPSFGTTSWKGYHVTVCCPHKLCYKA